MKCPICGEELRPSQKYPDYLLCYDCKKKFKAPQKKAAKPKKEEEPEEREACARRPEQKKGKRRNAEVREEQACSNIPPKEVRQKREDEMRKAYDDMVAVADDEPSRWPVIVLGIAVLILAAVIVCMLFL